MKETIESVKGQFDALISKIDPTSASMLGDRDYTSQLSDCVARIYVMLNSGMCEEVTVCQNCAEHRDYFRQAMEVFEAAAFTGNVDSDVIDFYFDFVRHLRSAQQKIDEVLSSL